MRKYVLAAVILAVVLGSVSAQQPVGLNNRVGLSLGLVSAEFSYERVFSENFSALAQASYSTIFFADSLSFSGKARWYPFGKTFFLEAGGGYSYGFNAIRQIQTLFADILLNIITLGFWSKIVDIDYGTAERKGGLLLQPGFGWNIDIGHTEGFRMPVSFGADIRLGDPLTVLPFIRLGVSYAF